MLKRSIFGHLPPLQDWPKAQMFSAQSSPRAPGIYWGLENPLQPRATPSKGSHCKNTMPEILNFAAAEPTLVLEDIAAGQAGNKTLLSDPKRFAKAKIKRLTGRHSGARHQGGWVCIGRNACPYSWVCWVWGHLHHCSPSAPHKALHPLQPQPSLHVPLHP